MPTLPLLLAALLILLTSIFLRILLILPSLNPRPPTPFPRPPGTPTHLLIVLGSGGHTAEMLSLLHNLDPNRYTHRSYVVSSGDEFSAERAREFERGLRGKGKGKGKGKGGGNDRSGNGNENRNDEGKGFSIHLIPRARTIHQPLLSTPFTSLRCLYASLILLYNHPHGYPDLVLTNGPATALMVILASTIIRFFAFMPVIGRPGTVEKMRTIYVESWARVKRMSLSGRIIVWCGLCNRVVVQWKGLEERGWGEYRGALVR
ncbi:hypothetical protein JMJ35_003044 [Cladonia borealis]|uniref:UDP-N-acetylglucosamine transferase subunit ALG14 n=1 Tax=Cladonia borealis TaxID=184061 RepID=A0AA39R3Z2_9LECA|nr:hypothetical protein JMJ35_003044 [Cladonia borealis]